MPSTPPPPVSNAQIHWNEVIVGGHEEHTLEFLSFCMLGIKSETESNEWLHLLQQKKKNVEESKTTSNF